MKKQEFIKKIKKIKKLSSRPHTKSTVAYETIWHLAYVLEKDLNALIKDACEKQMDVDKKAVKKARELQGTLKNMDCIVYPRWKLIELE